MSPLHVAAALGDEEHACHLLEDPLAVTSTRHPTGKTPLHVAAENGRLPMVIKNTHTKRTRKISLTSRGSEGREGAYDL